jgi:peptide/nickel transport system permease protein
MKFLFSLRKAPLSAQLGLLLCTLFGLVAVFASWIATYDGAAIVADVWAPMSRAHLLGTDNLGRDLFSRLIYGTRTTLLIAGLATILSFTLGSVTGFVAAVAGGWVDTVMSRFVDVLMAIPTLIFALVVLSVFPSTVPVLILVMGILDSTRVYRLSRAVAMDINVMDFVEAARLRGEKTTWIVFHEILPNALTPLVSELGLRFIFAVLFLSSLSFLGLGVQPPEADWGGLVKENKEGIVFGIPAALAPAAAIALLTIAVNLVADWVLSLTTNIRGDQGHV